MQEDDVLDLMIVRRAGDRKSTFPAFYLAGSPLDGCEEIKYLGHIISDDWMDDKDLYRQRCKIYFQANMLIRKFSMCSNSVKCFLSEPTSHLYICCSIID